MTKTPCPECGHPTAEVQVCANCGYALTNGTMQPVRAPFRKPPPPPELAGYVFEKMTPEIEALLGPFDEQVYRDALREFEENGGYQLKDFIEELEEEARRRG